MRIVIDLRKRRKSELSQLEKTILRWSKNGKSFHELCIFCDPLYTRSALNAAINRLISGGLLACATRKYVTTQGGLTALRG